LARDYSLDQERARLLARLGRGCLGWAITAATEASLLQRRDEVLDRLIEVSAGDLEGRFACATELTAEFGRDRISVRERLDLWLDWWRDLLMVKLGSQEAVVNIDRLSGLIEMAGAYTAGQLRGFIDSIRQAEEQLQRNASPKLVLETLLLDMPGRK
jgi:DNA polymerase-3 subunit delta'